MNKLSIEAKDEKLPLSVENSVFFTVRSGNVKIFIRDATTLSEPDNRLQKLILWYAFCHLEFGYKGLMGLRDAKIRMPMAKKKAPMNFGVFLHIFT